MVTTNKERSLGQEVADQPKSRLGNRPEREFDHRRFSGLATREFTGRIGEAVSEAIPGGGGDELTCRFGTKNGGKSKQIMAEKIVRKTFPD